MGSPGARSPQPSPARVQTHVSLRITLLHEPPSSLRRVPELDSGHPLLRPQPIQKLGHGDGCWAKTQPTEKNGADLDLKPKPRCLQACVRVLPRVSRCCCCRCCCLACFTRGANPPRQIERQMIRKWIIGLSASGCHLWVLHGALFAVPATPAMPAMSRALASGI